MSYEEYEEAPLFRDRDGSILLIRLSGDDWKVCTNQRDADWIRETECSGALAGLTTEGVAFLRVVASPDCERCEGGGSVPRDPRNPRGFKTTCPDCGGTGKQPISDYKSGEGNG